MRVTATDFSRTTASHWMLRSTAFLRQKSWIWTAWPN